MDNMCAMYVYVICTVTKYQKKAKMSKTCFETKNETNLKKKSMIHKVGFFVGRHLKRKK